MIRIFILLLLLKGLVMAIDEPQYTLIEKNDIFEIRAYSPYIVAQTVVSGEVDEMGSKAFRILFKYISGVNKQSSKISMTAPVIQESTQKKGEKIPMTAPVIQEIDASNPNSSVYSFVMPLDSTLDTLPVPLDKRITLKKVAAKTVAVRVFSGSWSESNYIDNKKILLDALNDANIKTILEVSYARYNSPFSLWFLRRNEIMIEVNK